MHIFNCLSRRTPAKLHGLGSVHKGKKLCGEEEEERDGVPLPAVQRPHRVLLLGGQGVGKSCLAHIFSGLDDNPDCEDEGSVYSRAVIVDDEESAIVLYDISDQDSSPWLREQWADIGDAYAIVYSVTDRSSFEKASELRIQLRRARQTENIPIILVGNKSDLVRTREVSVEEGRACAMVFDCKFIETSAALQHNVRDLFEGAVRQIRLRQNGREQNLRGRAGLKSLANKAKRFIGRIVAQKNRKIAFRQKSKSCHNLAVL